MGQLVAYLDYTQRISNKTLDPRIIITPQFNGYGNLVPRSNGCVTAAAQHEADPPNQKG